MDQHVSTSSQRKLLKRIQGTYLSNLIDHKCLLSPKDKPMMQLQHPIVNLLKLTPQNNLKAPILAIRLVT
jgi:hypothetical protein